MYGVDTDCWNTYYWNTEVELIPNPGICDLYLPGEGIISILQISSEILHKFSSWMSYTCSLDTGMDGLVALFGIDCVIHVWKSESHAESNNPVLDA